MSTLTLRLSEKDLGQPFEYVQTLQSNIQVVAKDPDDVYAKAQKEVTDAGGQVVDSKMTRNNDGRSVGTIRGRVDSEKFPALREALKKLGVVTHDTVNQQKTARGGSEATPKADAPLRKEQAVVDFTRDLAAGVRDPAVADPGRDRPRSRAPTRTRAARSRPRAGRSSTAR
jgi:hypothetical protein